LVRPEHQDLTAEFALAVDHKASYLAERVPLTPLASGVGSPRLNEAGWPDDRVLHGLRKAAAHEG